MQELAPNVDLFQDGSDLAIMKKSFALFISLQLCGCNYAPSQDEFERHCMENFSIKVVDRDLFNIYLNNLSSGYANPVYNPNINHADAYDEYFFGVAFMRRGVCKPKYGPDDMPGELCETGRFCESYSEVVANKRLEDGGLAEKEELLAIFRNDFYATEYIVPRTYDCFRAYESAYVQLMRKEN